jgi:FkbM family methyltransferase
MKIRKFIYQTGLRSLRFFWSISGGRRITAFGERFLVTANTIFPSYRKFPLPKGSCLSEMVRYTDFVQLHSVCNLVTELQKPTIIDIGAYHGAYAIILGKIAQSKGGKVIAVEPVPESYAVLVKNISLNGLSDTVICEQVAILDKPGRLISMELKGVESKLSEKQNGACCPVTVVTLEQLLQKYEVTKVDLLIIDVEGAELPVLRSFPWQSASVGRIFCELHPYGWKDFGYCGEDFSNFLRNHGYRCVDMYLKEHDIFKSDTYIGPSILVPPK